MAAAGVRIARLEIMTKAQQPPPRGEVVERCLFTQPPPVGHATAPRPWGRDICATVGDDCLGQRADS